MHKLERLEALVHDVLLVDVFQNVGANHDVQVDLHVLKHKINVPVIVRLEDVQQTNDVFVMTGVELLRYSKGKCTQTLISTSKMDKTVPHIDHKTLSVERIFQPEET